MALVDRVGFLGLFWIAGAVGAVSLVLTLTLRETLPRPSTVPFTARSAVSAGAAFPSLIELCLMFTYGTQVAFLPLHADTRGVNPGVFFLVFAITITLTRGTAGRLSDRRGRAPVAAAWLAIAAAALVMLALSESAAGLAAAGAVYGIAYGAAQPALVAWCVDRVPEGDRGRAMGTFYSAMEIGIAVARWGFIATFVATAGVALAGATLALTRREGVPAAWRAERMLRPASTMSVAPVMKDDSWQARKRIG